MDIKTIVNQKIDNMLNNGECQKFIEKEIEKAITEGIKRSINGYSIKSEIEEKLKKEVSSVLDEISLKGYNELVLQQMRAVIEQLTNAEYSKKIEDEFKKIFIESKEEIKLSEIFEKVRDEFFDEDDQQDKHFTLIFDVEKGACPSSKFVDIYFDEKEGVDKDECDYSLSIYVDKSNKGKICRLKMEGPEFNYRIGKISCIGFLNEFENILFNANLNKIKIIVDVDDEDDVDTSLYDF